MVYGDRLWCLPELHYLKYAFLRGLGIRGASIGALAPDEYVFHFLSFS